MTKKSSSIVSLLFLLCMLITAVSCSQEQGGQKDLDESTNTAITLDTLQPEFTPAESADTACETSELPTEKPSDTPSQDTAQEPDITQDEQTDPPAVTEVIDNAPDRYEMATEPPASDQTIFFSYLPGIYTDPIALCLTPSDPSYTIRYTTDCSLPTKSSRVYSEPIPLSYESIAVQDVTVYNLRAAAFDSKGNRVGQVYSASYLFPKDEDRFSTKVVSIVTERGNLYGQSGIITNYTEKGRDWERPANFQLFDYQGNLSVQQDMGIRLHGTGSRVNEQKNFRLYARKDYTPRSGKVNAALFPGLVSEASGELIEKFDRFLLRGGASNFGNSMITNQIAYEIMEGSAVDCADYEPVALYLNGEYYGLMMLMEDYCPQYFEEHYGVNEDFVSTINFGFLDNTRYLTWKADDCTVDELGEWRNVLSYLTTTDLSIPENYQRASTMIDTENFIQYIVFECYVNNWDWPRNNQRVWRYNGCSGSNLSGKATVGGYNPDASGMLDGRWRFIAKDLDISLGVTVNELLGYASDPYTDFFHVMQKDENGENKTWQTFLSLMENEEFCKEFYHYVCEFMSTRGSTDNILSIINTLSLQVSKEMGAHVEKYQSDISDWDLNLIEMRRFAKARPSVVLDSVYWFSFMMGHDYQICPATLTSSFGGSPILFATDLGDASTVYLLQNVSYDLSFHLLPGYALDRVTVRGGSYQNGKLTLTQENATVSITYKKVDEPKPQINVLLNEVGYRAKDACNGYDWVELYNPTDSEINLEGYSLNVGNRSHTLPAITISPHGYRVIFFSATNDGGVYAPFTISSNQTLTLSDASGKTIDSLLLFAKGSTRHPARYPDGGEWIEIERKDATPNGANTTPPDPEIYYGEAIRNTIVFRGVVMSKDYFTVNDQGHLTTTKAALATTPELIGRYHDRLLSYFAKYAEHQVIDLTQWAIENEGSPLLDVYYIEACNTCIFSAV